MLREDAVIRIMDSYLGYRSGGTDSVLLEGINLNVYKGELIALIGKNGCGKTTFLRSLIKLHKLIAGELYLFDRDIDAYSSNELARLIGFVSTNIIENAEMSVEELVRIGRYPYTNMFGIMDQSDINQIQSAMNVCGVLHLQNRKLSRLSDGERQRSMLARVFAQDTDIILLDEPTSFLDIPNKFEMFSLLSHLAAKGKSVIFTTHDLNLAAQYADKLWLINNKKISEGAPEDLFLGSEMTEQFAGEKLQLDKETGEFGPKIRENKYVRLSSAAGCDIAEIWTKKAFRRKGIGISEGNLIKSNLIIDVFISKEKDKFVWNLSSKSKNLPLTSIYQLITHLENQNYNEFN